MKRDRCGPVTLWILQASIDDVFGDQIRVHQSHRPFSRASEIIVVHHGDKRLRAVAREALANDKSTIQLDLRSRQSLGVLPSS